MLKRIVLGLVLLFTGACDQHEAAEPSPVAVRRPNLLLVIADDLGYSELGLTGSEVETPHIDALARSGVFLTNFHVAATCSPTRSMLMTGVDNHRNGLGNMGEFLTEAQQGQPGYEGYLNRRVATVAEILSADGYVTSFSGKWHLGTKAGQRPHDRGFGVSLALLGGAADAWSARGPSPRLPLMAFSRDGELTPRPDGVFADSWYTDHLLAFLGSQASRDRPFFSVLSFQGVHWPHHAPAHWLEGRAEKYREGWQALRAARHARSPESGLADPIPLPRDPDGYPSWNSLSAEEREIEAHRMAAHSAMVANLDHETGRVLEMLRRQNRLDDTLVIFVSDNGPDPSEPDRFPGASDWYAEQYPRRAAEELGGPGSFPSYGLGWATAGAASLRDHKGTAAEGGLRVPLIVSYPREVAGGWQTGAFGFATDIAATLLDAAGALDAADALEPAGAKLPESAAAVSTLHPLDGRSLMPLLLGEVDRVYGPDEPVAYQLMKNGALFLGDYKIVHNGPPTGDGQWQLFDLRKDPGEQNDLASSEPERLATMKRLYDDWAQEYGVIPMPNDYDVMRALTDPRAGRP